MSTSTGAAVAGTGASSIGQAAVPAPGWSLAAALLFAALLLSAGSLSDRAGARRAFGAGLAVFTLAPAACGLAPSLPALVAARFVQGPAAAVMMPALMALVSHAYPDPVGRARAVALWSMGAVAASASGPVLSGLLTSVSWRLIFFVNVLTYGAIEAGAAGITAPRVLAALAAAAAGLAAFGVLQARGRHPMLPPGLFRSRTVSVAVATGFAFMAGYYGLPFVMSLYLQQLRGLSALGTGVAFLPVMLTGAVLTPFSARLAGRFGARVLVTAGLLAMTAGLAAIALVPGPAPVTVLSALMMLTGLAGPLVMPPVTALLLQAVPAGRAGVASGVFNTGRQAGGALAVAVFGRCWPAGRRSCTACGPACSSPPPPWPPPRSACCSGPPLISRLPDERSTAMRGAVIYGPGDVRRAARRPEDHPAHGRGHPPRRRRARRAGRRVDRITPLHGTGNARRLPESSGQQGGRCYKSCQ